ncbi:M24 family metallopeptidase [Desulforamulus aquiferis]|uniref:Xaa-Pro peptidase family protein n=1 Tax=Desulforamulus aquiferis TaxID=1397668 RepID=A0AAW7ZFZ2_9FIRM|nr:Xaa-Pro peptidase family protein [Desulforamulus aquiferis]MDO7788173.1 Xaa-Pro peptidase family protein [Desulforamulus aquiferis]
MYNLIERILRTQQALHNTDIDLLLIVGRENLIYFSGITQMECMAIIIPKEGEANVITLWLDVDYVEQQSGLKTFGYVFPKENLATKVIEQIKNYGINKPVIGFEKYFVDISIYEALRSSFPTGRFVSAAEMLYKIRSIKDQQEVFNIRKAAKAACSGVDAAIKAIRTGVSELDILAEAEYAMLKDGSNGSPFRPQIVSGERTLLTHPSSSRKKINNGEIVVVHLGATYEGYCAKICRTVAIGDIPQEQEKIYYILKEAQEKSINSLAPGITAGEVDGAARRVIELAGYQQHFIDIIGYGVGLRQSEFYPTIGKGRNDTIDVNMVVDLLLPTIFLKGVGGPRITDIIHVGEEQNEILTDYPRQLVRL